MFYLIFQALYFILPAGIANMAPVFAKKINFLNIPVDFGKSFRGQRIFGDHKTWRGYFSAIIIGVIVSGIQAYLYFSFEFFQSLTIFPFREYNFILFGFLSALGAMIGDTVKSFFKRQANVQPGQKFIPWDQIDFILGALIFISFYFRPNWLVYVILLVLVPFLHVLINRIGFWLGIHKTKW
ncbi:MAG: CDP-2,3-bis-(O-geranylgeranyl)-sn-glycerol synthase [Patescibacteria group bacterium]|nr:CDP-2,3-bis-(O-geranylgeranyl)-sn-glycerol synthase [Patescibacteria group bacterium]